VRISRLGITRTVFVFKNFVIKIPNTRYRHRYFIEGCLANWTERQASKNLKHFPDSYKIIAPTYFCSWFGLIQIQKRAIQLDRELTEEEKEIFSDLTKDIKSDNVGWINDKLVCFDYA